MCKFLKISRSLIYYNKKNKIIDKQIETDIIIIFKNSRNNYGSRKIKVELKKRGFKVSLRKIRRIMNLHGLVSNYTVKQFKIHKSLCNNDVIENSLNREFNRKTELVCRAFSKINKNLSNINVFHTDRGNEFKNKLIDDILNTFNIKRSLSKKGCPYDNAVTEATYKIIKTEFSFNRCFNSFEELETELFDYVNWYNNIRIHSSLNYETPVNYRMLNALNISDKNCTKKC